MVDEEALYERREDVAEEINEILLHKLRNNIRFCAQCGAALPCRCTSGDGSVIAVTGGGATGVGGTRGNGPNDNGV